ncbi:MAG: YaiI/YqxD family protein [Chitinivibrionales bacterium]|nr:YaiI/YqxD family protein [Chitinivibrionales bacterium]
MPHIYIDADACPVKQETYQVAERYGLPVTLVANSWMRIPDKDWLKLFVVGNNPDAADDWIVENVKEDDIVISGDILLADRCLKKGALVLGTTGREFTAAAIGDAVATRELLAELRAAGNITGGPASFQKKDRSRFLQTFDQMIQRIRRKTTC